MTSQGLARELLSFVTIGFLGFVSDAILLSLLQWLGGFDLVTSRLGAFAVTVSITWWLNRRWTFRSDATVFSEWLRYVAVNGVGAVLNLGIFFWLVYGVAALSDSPLIALALAAFITMNYGFFASKCIAFRQAHR